MRCHEHRIPDAPCCVDALIPYDPDLEPRPVSYLGEGGFADVYDLSTPDDGGELVGCLPPGDVFLHAISAYTDLLDNPTIVRCEGQAEDLTDICDGDVSGVDCQFLDLASFFPFDGALPDDGRIGSNGAASFSLYFLVDYGLAGGGRGHRQLVRLPAAGEQRLTPDDPGMSVFREMPDHSLQVHGRGRRERKLREGAVHRTRRHPAVDRPGRARLRGAGDRLRRRWLRRGALLRSAP